MNYLKKSLKLFLVFLSFVSVSLFASESDLKKASTQAAPLKTEKRLVSMEAEVPSAGYSIAIEQVSVVNDEIWVVAMLNKLSNDDATEAHSMNVKDTVTVEHYPSSLPCKYFLVNDSHNTIGWHPKSEDGKVKIISSFSSIKEELDTGKTLWQR